MLDDEYDEEAEHDYEVDGEEAMDSRYDDEDDEIFHSDGGRTGSRR